MPPSDTAPTGDPGIQPAPRPGTIDPTVREGLAAATHDINNALNSVLVATHLLQLTAADPEAVRRHADRIAHAGRQGVVAAASITALLRSNGPSTPPPVSEPHA